MILLSAVLVMLVFGVLTIFSSSSFYGREKYSDALIFFKLHMIKVVSGLALLFIAVHLDYHKYRWITPVIVMLLVILLIATFFGPEFKGSHRAVVLFGKQFQPSAFMKLVFIFYISAIFTRGLDARIFEGKWLYYQYGFLIFITGLVLVEPDLGSAMVLFTVGVIMFFLAGVPYKNLSKIILFIIPMLIIGLIRYGYQMDRLKKFINPILGRGVITHQIKQSIIGLARGGFMGVGYGEGKQKFLFLPEPFSDFAISSFGEEFGFFGLFILFVMLLIVLWRGTRIALQAPDRYGYLLAGGITSMILINALINTGVAVNLLPITGLPFPFVSYGGSSLIVHLIGIGILLNISRTKKVPFQEYSYDRGIHLNGAQIS